MSAFLWTLVLLAQGQVMRGPVDLAGYAFVDLEITVVAAHLTVQPTEGTVLTLSQSPLPDPRDSLFLYLEPTGDGARVTIQPRHPREEEGPEGWKRLLRFLRDQPDSQYLVTITLPRSVPFREVVLQVGAVEGHLDLGGLTLEDLEVDLGAAAVTLDFSEPLAAEAEHLEMNAGAGDLQVLHLGNGRFQSAELNTGVAAAALDLSGAWPPGARLEVSSGLASVCFHIPRDLGVRVKTEGFLVVRDFDDLVRENGTWVTPDYREASRHLLLSLGGAFTHYEVAYDEEDCDVGD